VLRAYIFCGACGNNRTNRGGFQFAAARLPWFSMIGSEDGRLEPYIRLWREGQVLADSDPDIKAAYLLTMNMWHAETVAIIEQGLASGEFRSAEPAADIAWRFIALVCGLDGIYALDTQALDEAAFSRYVNKMITLELF
ncbi:TetR family transcriptional regulator, partial [Klebsiella pneumoniae]|uniref:TetR family transcriptional regulator n=1 Tax=Klebsiella pneumoniae TaxID=573 RepID=UPI00216461C9